MGDCENLKTCAFFKTYENNPNIEAALKGFVSMYCKGPKQDQCIRKKVSKALGGPQNVPTNMMPNGMPLQGTSRDNWPDQVKQVLQITV